MKNWILLTFLFLFAFGQHLQGDVILNTAFGIDSSWSNGYIGHITIANSSSNSTSSWQIDFDLPSEQTISTLWNGQYITSNSSPDGESPTNIQHITVKNETWNAVLNPNQSYTIGFQIDNPQAINATVAGLLGVGSPTSQPPTSTTLPQFPINAKYTIDSSWQTGYQATVTLTNNTAYPSSSWVATFSLPSNQTISSFWNGAYNANGQLITVKNPTWEGGGIIPANSSTTFGMIIQTPHLTSAALSNLQALANSNMPAPPPIPVAPTLNPISISTTAPNNYTVSWDSVPYATLYKLEQDITNNFSNPMVVAQGAILSQIFNNQANGTYYYRVSAVDSSGSSPYSNVQNVVINAQIVQLNAPLLEVIDDPSGAPQYQILWSTVENAQGYTLQESLSSDFSSYQTIFSGISSSYQASGKSPGTYFYRVNAFSGNNTSNFSNVESAIVTQQQQSTAFVEGYWESWNSSDSVNAIVSMNVDVINIAFANFHTTGTHTYAIAGVEADQATLTQLVTAAHHAGKKVKLSVGGATYPLSPQLKTVQDAMGMAQAVAQYVSKNSLDGVDYDIEDSPSASLQIALLQNTRQLLGNNAIISYTAEAPASTTAPYIQVISGAYQYVNYVTIMAYDYGPGYSYQQDIAGLESKGVPPSKIVLGLLPGDDDLNVFTSLNDITNGANYVKTNNLAGIMFWDLNLDYENMTGLGASAATNTAWNILH